MTEMALLQRALGDGRFPSDTGLDRLRQFSRLVEKWNTSINVVAKSTIGDLWNRHIVDSAQIFACVTADQKLWLDIGSGGGFPGIVVSILAADMLPQLKVALVESDRRKSVFLMECVRQIGLTATVHAVRVEDLPSQSACVVSARALAPLADLCGLATRHMREDSLCAFLKGVNADSEIIEARKHWQFDLDLRPSVTDSRASVLFLKGLRHV